MSLVERADVQDFLTGHGVTAVYGTAFIDARLAEAEAFLAKKINRSYGVSEEAARLFDGGGTSNLPIDECQDISAVETVDESGAADSAYASSDYRAHPLNEDPKFLLRLHSGVWPRGNGNIQVTAKWGEAAPDDVLGAIVALAALYVLAGTNLPTISGAVQGAVRQYSTGVYEVTFKDPQQKNFTAALTGWGEMIESVVALRQKRRPF